MITIVFDPGNTKPIDELYAFLSIDTGGEGICSATLPQLGHTQLVTGSGMVVEYMRNFAKEIARASGKRVRLVKFTRSEVMEVFKP